MLILTREVGESIVIEVGGRQVKITAGGLDGQQVKVGVTAPRDIPVVREELLAPDHPLRGGPEQTEREAAPASREPVRDGRKCVSGGDGVLRLSGSGADTAVAEDPDKNSPRMG